MWGGFSYEACGKKHDSIPMLINLVSRRDPGRPTKQPGCYVRVETDGHRGAYTVCVCCCGNAVNSIGLIQDFNWGQGKKHFMRGTGGSVIPILHFLVRRSQVGGGRGNWPFGVIGKEVISM